MAESTAVGQMSRVVSMDKVSEQQNLAMEVHMVQYWQIRWKVRLGPDCSEKKKQNPRYKESKYITFERQTQGLISAVAENKKAWKTSHKWVAQ